MTAEGKYEQLGGLRLQQASHVLDAKDMDPFFHELVDKVKVVLKRVFLFLGTCDVAAVANDGLDHTTSFLCCIDAEPHLITSNH